MGYKVDGPMTTLGKEAALAALRQRRENKPTPIDDTSLPAGSPMHFYCISCGHIAEVAPESYTWAPKKLCGECKALQDLDWLE